MRSHFAAVSCSVRDSVFRPLGGVVLAALVLAAPVGSASAQWIVPPAVFNNPFVVIGGFGLHSGYVGGSYRNVAGNVCTADVDMISTVVQVGAQWDYKWTITNSGSGDFVRYFQAGPGRGPKFLKVVPLSGSHAAPCDYPAGWPVGPSVQVDTFTGGAPVLGVWGGGWNPDTGLEAQHFMATPEPGSLALLATGAAIVALITRRRRVASPAAR